MIYLHSRHTPIEKLHKKYPGATIIDVTSRADEPWVKLSPFFPHGEIPIPFSEGETGQSVEGIWQGLKVFENEGIDPTKWAITDMKGLKRSERKFGPCHGHQKGIHSTELVPYIEARKSIFLPIYFWVLDHKVPEIMAKLRQMAKEGDLVLLDYMTNPVVEDPSKPLSHAALVRMRIEQPELLK